MDILVLDIGCTNSKAIVFSGSEITFRTSVKTPNNAQGIVDTARSLLGRVLSEGYELQGVILTSFSESVIVENADGELNLYGPYYETDVNEINYPATGYPCDPFPGVACILRDLKKRGEDVQRALPVSTMVAVQLVNNAAWRTWDWTHASNTGLYGRGRWIDDFLAAYHDWFDTKTAVHPNKIVGYINGLTPVFIGGHDTVFSIFNRDSKAYVSTGTYITASEPCIFDPIPGEKQKQIRYLQGVNGWYHRQVCYKREGHFSQLDALKIRETLSTNRIMVFGDQSHEVAGMLTDYDFNVIEQGNDLQHIGAMDLVRISL